MGSGRLCTGQSLGKQLGLTSGRCSDGLTIQNISGPPQSHSDNMDKPGELLNQLKKQNLRELRMQRNLRELNSESDELVPAEKDRGYFHTGTTTGTNHEGTGSCRGIEP